MIDTTNTTEERLAFHRLKSAIIEYILGETPWNELDQLANRFSGSWVDECSFQILLSDDILLLIDERLFTPSLTPKMEQHLVARICELTTELNTLAQNGIGIEWHKHRSVCCILKLLLHQTNDGHHYQPSTIELVIYYAQCIIENCHKVSEEAIWAAVDALMELPMNDFSIELPMLQLLASLKADLDIDSLSHWAHHYKMCGLLAQMYECSCMSIHFRLQALAYLERLTRQFYPTHWPTAWHAFEVLWPELSAVKAQQILLKLLNFLKNKLTAESDMADSIEWHQRMCQAIGGILDKYGESAWLTSPDGIEQTLDYLKAVQIKEQY